MGCKSPRVGHCDARTPRSVRYVRTRPVLRRHRESMDEFFVRTAGGCADFLSGAFPPPESAVRKAAQPMCFPGSLRRSPSAACCQQKEPPSALGTAEGGFFADEIAIGRLCPAAGAGRFQQDLLHLRPLRFHVRREPQLRAAAVEVLRWPVDLGNRHRRPDSPSKSAYQARS